jgi:hypothetical protein
MRWMPRRPSPATVIASLALLVACGGTGAAAVQAVLPANSVGTAQLKNNAVTSQKVLNGSLLKADFKPNQLPAGASGPTGPTGPAGPAGPSVKWALVRQDGAILGQSGGLTAVHAGSGHYIVDFGGPVTGKLILASMSLAGDNNFRGPVDASPCGGAPDSRPFACSTGNDTNHVEVFTSSPGSTSDQDHSFYVAVFG